MATMTEEIAVVKLGGKQHVVSAGSRFIVDEQKQAEGKIIETPNLLAPGYVSIKVLSHRKGRKINGLKFKNKVRYTRHYGFRAKQSLMEVIAVGAVSPTLPKTESAKTAKDTAVKKIEKKLAAPKRPRVRAERAKTSGEKDD